MRKTLSLIVFAALCLLAGCAHRPLKAPCACETQPVNANA